jgi:hypothetical protein
VLVACFDPFDLMSFDLRNSGDPIFVFIVISDPLLLFLASAFTDRITRRNRDFFEVGLFTFLSETLSGGRCYVRDVELTEVCYWGTPRSPIIGPCP